MAETTETSVRDMRRAICATRAGHDDDTDTQIRMLWTSMSAEDQEAAIAAADSNRRGKNRREAEKAEPESGAQSGGEPSGTKGQKDETA